MKLDNTINIIFKNVNNMKIPYLLLDKEYIKINNLHIHSKRLDLFLS